GDAVRRDVIGAYELRLAGRHVHGDVTARFLAAFEVHQHADAGAVQVAGQLARGLDHGEAAHADVLADLGDQLATQFVKGAAVHVDAVQGFEVGGLGGENRAGHPGREGLEVVAAGDEVGLAVHFHDRRLVGGFVEGDLDAALGRDAAGLLVSL